MGTTISVNESNSNDLLLKNSLMEGGGERLGMMLQLQQRLQQPPQCSPKRDQRWRDKPERIELGKAEKG